MHLREIRPERPLNADSASSESTLRSALRDIVIPHAVERLASLEKTMDIVCLPQISLFECQTFFHSVGGPTPNPANKKVFMRPDGGILFAVHREDPTKRVPILITEDKVQGTNDLLFAQGKKKQALGNAIERGAKNIRGAEMIFAPQDIFPYVIFASGCDFHHSETIGKRLEMMNMGFPNHYLEVGPESSDPDNILLVESLLEEVRVEKVSGRAIASIFVKAHRFDTMPHGASLWKKEEIGMICCRVIDQVVERLSLADSS
jgi:hypothetical protein